MNWDELEQKHKKQLEEFAANSQKAFQELMDKHDELYEAFRDLGEEVPLKIKERMYNESKAHFATWGEDGANTQQLKASQKQEIWQFSKKSKFHSHIEELKQHRREIEKEH